MIRTTKEQILHATDGGLQVFRHYIPFAITPGKKFRNPLYDDRRASCFIYKMPRTGIYRMNDFGDHTCSGDCFWFVAAQHGMDLQKDFPRILEKIIRDLSLSISLPESASGSIRSQVESVPMPRPTPTPTEPAGRSYRIEEKAFDESERAYWGQYGITPHVHPLRAPLRPQRHQATRTHRIGTATKVGRHPVDREGRQPDTVGCQGAEGA